MLISSLSIGQRFTLKGFDGIYRRVNKKSVGNVVYIKEGLGDIFYCADKRIKALVD